MRDLATILLVFLCMAAPAQPVAAQSDASRCAQEWSRFEESSACFAKYRVVGGGIKQEASKSCTEVPMPACPNPKRSSSERGSPPPASSNR
jgi:hypothetical protein